MIGEPHRGVEFAKWVAFALMVLDHVTIFVTDERPAWAYLLGRLVFPMFALALAYGLSRGGELSFDAASKRLLSWALVAQIPYSFLIPGVSLNVLFTLWSGTFLYQAFCWPRWNFSRGFFVFLAVLCSSAVEFGPVGVLCVVCAIGYARVAVPALEDRKDGLVTNNPRVAWAVGFWVCLTLLHAINGTPAAMAGPFVFWACVKWGDMPRVRHAFYWLYPAQWVVVAALRAVL